MTSRDPISDTSFTRHAWWRRWFGRRSERAAHNFLRNIGYKIVANNAEDRAGEIDLVAVDGRTLVVVEVRSSERSTHQDLALTIDAEKQRRLTNAALRFLKKHRLRDVGIRFDVLTVRWPTGAKLPDIRHYRDAFPAVGRFQMHS